MLIPIFKPGDVLFDKINVNGGKILVLDSKIKSETEEYTTDMDIGCGVTRHEIKTTEWVEYGVIDTSFNFIRIAEDALCRWYRRVSHVDLPYNFVEADSGEKDEELRNVKKAIEFYKDQLRDRRKDIRVLQDRVEEVKVTNLDLHKQISMLKDDKQRAEVGAVYDKAIATGKINSLIDTVQSLKEKNDKLSKEVEELNDQLRVAYGCIDRFTIDAVAGMRRAGCSVEKIAKTLNMPEQAIKVYLNAADVLDCKEE